jgi:hypothetical protein
LPAGWLGFPYEHKTIASIKIITQWDLALLLVLLTRPAFIWTAAQYFLAVKMSLSLRLVCIRQAICILSGKSANQHQLLLKIFRVLTVLQ